MTSPSTTPRALTGDPLIDAMTHGYYWNLNPSHTINWSIANGFNGEYWISPGGVAEVLNTAFAVFSYYADVKFNYVGYYTTPSAAYSGGSDITISLDSVYLDPAVWAVGFFPDTSYDSEGYQGAAGDIFLNINSQANSLPSYEPGSAGFFLALHEIGHTLGLKHPHDDGGTGHPTLNDIGLGDLDIDWATVMSYDDDYNFNFRAFDPATPMVLDVLALQYIYGKNMTTNADNSVYTLPLSRYYATIWDAGGTDSVDVSSSSVAWEIVLPDVQLSTLVDTLAGYAAPLAELALSSPRTLYWLLGDIENATGSRRDDALYGNSLGNRLNGGGGKDFMSGGLGDDFYYVDNISDVVEEMASEGYDTVISMVTYVLSEALESLSLTGTGRANAYGNSTANILTGNGGNNTLDGGGGGDTMRGGAGNDLYVVQDAGDIVEESAGGGTDIVRSYIDYVLGQDVEQLLLDGGAVFGTGNGLANALTGNAGNNTLDGAGGVDKLAGGAGDDTYLVDVIGQSGSAKIQDTVTEATNAGVDTLLLRAAGSLGLMKPVTMTLGTNLENFDISQTGSNGINITGNNANNTLTGNDGVNTLNGGKGADAMFGGDGDDAFIVDSLLDTAEGEGGSDTVIAGISWVLSASTENLVLTGSKAMDGAGNALANSLTGNSGVNRLDGDDGADRLSGLNGADILNGGLGDDMLDGGAGIDTLTGGDGSDSFVFLSAQARSASNADIITDFTAGAGGDVLDISNILAGFDGDISHYVTLIEVNGDTQVRVDANGLTGGQSFALVATLAGVTGLNAGQLFSDGNIAVLAVS